MEEENIKNVEMIQQVRTAFIKLLQGRITDYEYIRCMTAILNEYSDISRRVE